MAKCSYKAKSARAERVKNTSELVHTLHYTNFTKTDLYNTYEQEMWNILWKF